MGEESVSDRQFLNHVCTLDVSASDHDVFLRFKFHIGRRPQREDFLKVAEYLEQNPEPLDASVISLLRKNADKPQVRRRIQIHSNFDVRST